MTEEEKLLIRSCLMNGFEFKAGYSFDGTVIVKNYGKEGFTEFHESDLIRLFDEIEYAMRGKEIENGK